MSGERSVATLTANIVVLERVQASGFCVVAAGTALGVAELGSDGAPSHFSAIVTHAEVVNDALCERNADPNNRGSRERTQYEERNGSRVTASRCGRSWVGIPLLGTGFRRRHVEKLHPARHIGQGLATVLTASPDVWQGIQFGYLISQNRR